MANAASANSMSKAASLSFKERALSWGPLIGFVVTIGFFLTTFYQFASIAGGSDHWASLQSQVQIPFLLTIIGTFVFAVSSLGYFIANPTKAVYYSIVVSCVALGVAFGAFYMALITR